jgi:hypothetical protein
MCVKQLPRFRNFLHLLIVLLFQAYITGNAFVVLTKPDTILQTIYDDDDNPLEAIAIDEGSGKIATCAGSSIRIYRPYGQGEDALKVCCQIASSSL